MGKDLNGKELGVGYSQRPDGRYQAYFRFNGSQIVVYGVTLKECREKRDKRLRDLEDGIVVKKITLNAYYKEWMLNAKKDGRRKGSTLANYKNLYDKHIKPKFGRRKVAEIRPIEIKTFQRELSEKYSARTVNSITDFMHLLYTDMIEDDVVFKNPVKVKHVEKQGTKTVRNNARALTKDEKTIFLKYAQRSFYYLPIRLMFATGMRAGEVRGLKWSDYDKENGVLHIRRTASVDANGKLTMNTPKSKSGLRDIPLNDEIIRIIEERKQQRLYLEGKIRKIDDYMFKSTQNKVMSRNMLKKSFDLICRYISDDGIQFERISPHACRHTFITECLHDGFNEFVVKDIVGHAPSAKVTTEVYLGRDQDRMKEVMQNRKTE